MKILLVFVYMFKECSSLLSLLDISKWGINNITDIRSMFSGCSSLLSLSDISKWDTNNIADISFMFSGFSSLYLNGILIMLLTWVGYFMDIHHYQIYQIYQIGVLAKLLTWVICLMDVHHY